MSALLQRRMRVGRFPSLKISALSSENGPEWRHRSCILSRIDGWVFFLFVGIQRAICASGPHVDAPVSRTAVPAMADMTVTPFTQSGPFVIPSHTFLCNLTLFFVVLPAVYRQLFHGRGP